MRKIGSGTHATVYETPEGYALKKFKSVDIGNVITEMCILTSLNHPNVIHADSININEYSLTMPLAYNTLDNIESLKGNDKIELRRGIFYQILEGIEYCHSVDVWHLDLKPENVLLFESKDKIPIVKIADFNISMVYVSEMDKKSLSIMTALWRAPEIFFEERQYDESVDIWSIGVMLLNAVADTIIFRGSEKEIIKYIFFQLGTPDPKEWKGFSQYNKCLKPEKEFKRRLSAERIPTTKDEPFDKDEYEVINNMVTWPDKRLSASELLKLDYFKTKKSEEKGKPLKSLKIDLMKGYNKYLNLKMRRLLFEWLYEVTLKMKTSERALIHCYILIDHYLEEVDIHREQLQGYGMACYFISNSLMNHYHNIEFDDLEYMCDYSFSEDEIKEFVQNVLLKLDCDIIFENPYKESQNLLVFLASMLNSVETQYTCESLCDLASNYLKYVKGEVKTVDGFKEDKLDKPFDTAYLNKKLKL